MKDSRIPSTQVDVVEIMKKIRQSAANTRSEVTTDETVRKEAKSEFLSLAQSAQVPDYLVDSIRQQTVFSPYDPRTLYASSRPGVGSLIGWIRKILRPITKLFINLDPLAHDVHRLTILNNFYMKSIQDLMAKNAKLTAEVHSIRRRSGHHRPKEEGHTSRHSHGNNNRRYSRSGHNNRDNNNPRGNNPRNPTTTSEPSAQ